MDGNIGQLFATDGATYSQNTKQAEEEEENSFNAVAISRWMAKFVARQCELNALLLLEIRTYSL